jgi:Family of unknown function (DUF6286)
MIRRPRRTVPAVLVGAVLLAAAVVLAISCVQLIVGRIPLVPFGTIAQLAADTTLSNPVVVIGGATLAMVGLVLLLCALLPGTPQVLALASINDHTDAGVTRHSLARDLTSHARRTDGITDARVTVGARTITVNARTPLRDRSGLSERVREQVTARLDYVNLARPTRVRVTITPDRSAR